MNRCYRSLAMPLVVSLLFSSLVLAADKKDKTLTVNLDYKKTTVIAPEANEGKPIDLTGLSSMILKVEPFVDARKEATKIGQNLEDADKGKVVPVVTTGDVGAFCSEITRQEFEGWGFRIGDSNATKILKGEVLAFWVEETTLYKANVRIRMTLTDPGGKELYSALAQGDASRFGRSLKAENYQETFSDALFEALARLMGDEKFHAALRT